MAWLQLRYILLTLFLSTLVVQSSAELSPIGDSSSYGPLVQSEQNEIENGLSKLKDFFLMAKNMDNHSSLYQKTEFTDGLICTACHSVQGKIYGFLKQKYGLKFLFGFLTMLCDIFTDRRVCNGSINNFGNIIVDGLIDHYFDTEFVCTLIRACTNHYIALDADDYARNLLKDKPVNATIPKVNKNATTWRMLQVSDIHIDEQYLPGSLGDCGAPLCCRKENGNGTEPENTAGEWGFLGYCDIPKKTFLNFIDLVVNEIKPDFIIWTGDNPPHNVWDDNKKEAIRITELIAGMLENSLKKNNQTSIPVYPAVGNHEDFPNDQFDVYNKTRDAEWLKTMAQIYRPMIGEEAYNKFSEKGFYSLIHPNSNLKIISLNCFLCDTLNFFLISDPTDPYNQVEWLENELRDAEKKNQAVFIIGHISPGDPTFLTECTKRYSAIADRFSHIIRGQFFGHTHNDEFKILKEYFNKDKIAGIAHLAPSMTTYTSLNPSFRVFDIDSDTKVVKDYYQYRLNLTEANANPEQKLNWNIAYQATKAFNITDLTDYDAFERFLDKAATDKDSLSELVERFFSGGPDVNTFLKDSHAARYFTCRLKEDSFIGYVKCAGVHLYETQEYLYILLEFLTGKWYIKKDDYKLKFLG